MANYEAETQPNINPFKVTTLPALKESGQRDPAILYKIAETTKSVLGRERAHRLVLVGSVALRALEASAGIPNEGSVWGDDVDAVLLYTDRKLQQKIREKMRKAEIDLRVDISRLAKPWESRKSVLQGFHQKRDGTLYSSAIFGLVKTPISPPLDIVEIPLENGSSIHTFSPAVMLFAYYIRALAGPKRKDKEERKFRRLLAVEKNLRAQGIILKRPYEYPELRAFRKETPKWRISKIVHDVVEFDNKHGKPLQKLGAGAINL